MHQSSAFNFQLGLIGYPLGHSLSPKIHQAALRSCGLDGDYSLFPIPPEDKQGLADLFSAMRRDEIHGLNVTIPHKQNVIEFLDELTPTAGSIGAVNTIYLREGRLVGDNTDAPGFLQDLNKFLSREKINDKNALILGAGGSARAVVYALIHDGWEVTITARRLEQAQQLAKSLTTDHSPITTIDLSSLKTHLQSQIPSLSLIVNTTHLGMFPNTDQSPWPENLPLPHAAIYDLVYNPRQTRLVTSARTQGLPATTGLGMLVEQAALSFQLWTGRNPSREILFESANQSLPTNH